MDLVIMAAGMGSRFGGLKQIEKFGPNGEFLIDYSIYDAIKYGFKRVVFIIKKENEEIFKSTIGKRVESHIPVEYVFQDMEDIPVKLSENFERIKPWGTAHAIYCCRNVVKENFAIINADDFYGADAYRAASEFLNSNKDEKTFGMVGYEIKNTLSETGSVKRGVCNFKDGYLTSLTESSVAKEGKGIIAKPLSGEPSFKVDDNSICSMNMFLFTVVLLTAILAGCSDGSSATDPADIKGETFDGGNVSALVPDGWMGFHGVDFFDEYEEGYDPNVIQIIKAQRVSGISSQHLML